MHFLRLREDAAKVLEVSRHGFALDSNLRQSVFGVGNEPRTLVLGVPQPVAVMRVSLLANRAGVLLGLGDHPSGFGTRIVLEARGLLALVGGALVRFVELRLCLLQVLVHVGRGFPLVGEVVLLGFVATDLEFDVEIESCLLPVRDDLRPDLIRLEGELGANGLRLLRDLRAERSDLGSGIRPFLIDLERQRGTRIGQLGLECGPCFGGFGGEIGRASCRERV